MAYSGSSSSICLAWMVENIGTRDQIWGITGSFEVEGRVVVVVVGVEVGNGQVMGVTHNGTRVREMSCSWALSVMVDSRVLSRRRLQLNGFHLCSVVAFLLLNSRPKDSTHVMLISGIILYDSMVGCIIFRHSFQS